jgi:hypothetical protein
MRVTRATRVTRVIRVMVTLKEKDETRIEAITHTQHGDTDIEGVSSGRGRPIESDLTWMTRP